MDKIFIYRSLQTILVEHLRDTGGQGKVAKARQGVVRTNLLFALGTKNGKSSKRSLSLGNNLNKTEYVYHISKST